MEAHQAVVDTISRTVAQFHTSETPFRIYHGSTNSTRHASFDPSRIVDVSSLCNILSICPTTKTAIVEPNVPMDVLVRETIKAGLLPPVVMEFPGITVGGGFVGTAGESSSFKHGFFDCTILEAEVVLANGNVVVASETQERALFKGLRGSFGTLGVLTKVTLKLMDMKKFVEVTYHATTSFAHSMQKLQEETKQDDVDYVDGIIFSKDSGIIVTGRLTDSPPSPASPLCHFSKPWNEWFWIHAKSLIAKGRTTEHILVEDYLFRFDRGAFWMGWHAFRHFRIPFLRLTRFLLDYFMHTRIMYHALHASGYTDRYIIQDIALPAPAATSFVEWVDAHLAIYPLWLCPLRSDARSSMGHPQDDPSHQGEYINVGVWGPYPSSETEFVRMNRLLESKVHSLGGLKWLYGRVFYTEDEWWAIYDAPKYHVLRERYNAASLPSTWDKVKDRGRKSAMEPGVRGWLKSIVMRSELLSGLYGVYKAVMGGDYLLKKEKKLSRNKNS